MWKRFTFSTIVLPPRLNLWDFDVRFVQKINRCTDKCSAGMCLNSQIDVVRLLHFYWAKATDFTELKLCEVSVKCWAKWFTLINHSWNQVKTSYWLLIDVKCWFWTFFAPKCFLTFLGEKIYFVNHSGSYKKCDLLTDVKSWFWAFFAPK